MKKYLFIILALMIAVPVLGANQWDKLEIKSATEINNYDVVIPTNNEALDRLLTNYRQGVKIIYSSASAIKVEDGEIVCSNSGGTIRRFRKNTTATTTVDWDDIDTGSEAADTTYYVYAVADTDITGFTFKISESATSPDGATYFKKIATFYNDDDSDITYDDIVNYQLEEKSFGDWETKSANTTYQATTDGFVVAVRSANGSSSFNVLTDSATPPTEVRGSHGDSGDDADDSKGSSSSPVRAGDYYKVTYSGGAPTVYWVPHN